MDAAGPPGPDVRSGVLGKSGALLVATGGTEGVEAALVAPPELAAAVGCLAIWPELDAGSEPGALTLGPVAAFCELLGIEGLMGAGSKGLGSVVIGCSDVADPGGFGREVAAGGTAAVVPLVEARAVLIGD